MLPSNEIRQDFTLDLKYKRKHIIIKDPKHFTHDGSSLEEPLLYKKLRIETGYVGLPLLVHNEKKNIRDTKITSFTLWVDF